MTERCEKAAEWAASYSRAEGIRAFFAPTANLATGAVVGIGVLPRPRDAGMAEVVAAVGGTDRQSAMDAGAAAAGIRRATELGGVLPLHVDLLADTVAEGPDGALTELHRAVADARRTPGQVVLEIGSPMGEVPDAALVAGARALRERGYRIAIDEIGTDDHALALIARLAPDLLVLDAHVTAGLTTDPGAAAVADAVVALANRIGAAVVASGVDTPADLEAARGHGVGLGRGALVGGAARRPVTRIAEPLPVLPAVPPPGTTTLARFIRPAVMVSEDATGEEVRDLFRSSPEVSGVVLTTSAERPVGMVERTRFLLAVSARFGFALHAERPVRDLADPPRVLPVDADPRDAVRLLGSDGRADADVAVVDDYGRCRGVVHTGDLLRALAGMEYRRALGLHPVTGLPGLPALVDMLGGRPVTALVVPELPAGFTEALEAQRWLGGAVTRALARFAGAAVAHGTGDTLAVLLPDPAALPAFEAALRAALAGALAVAVSRPGPRALAS